ncbi:MAG: hypothetical protein ACC657_16850 [Thiohalomonadales bacterium]
MIINYSNKINAIILLIFIFTQNAFAKTYHYEVSIPDDLKQLTVKICFDKQLPLHTVKFHSIGEQASNRISTIVVQGLDKSRTINNDGDYIILKNIVKGDCLEYKTAIESVDIHRLIRIPATQKIITDPNEWLWYPDTFSKKDKIDIEFNHSSSINISAPWTLISRAITKTKYQFLKYPEEWDSIIAFGYFNVEDIKLGKSVIRYALLNGSNKLDKGKIRDWVEQNINALTTIYGEFPVLSLQLLVVPLGKGGEPVPWGEVKRGGGPAVHLYIDETRTKQEFMDDWVFSHELSHLLHPRIRRASAWLYEGLASYYQNVVRARQGLLTPNQAWQKLHSGFERGINKTPKNKTLSEVTKNVMKNRAFMRVYWSGAAISLIADVKLRQLSHNKKSLDTILHQFKKCCLSDIRWWTAIEVMKKFDALSNTTVFTDVYNQNVFATKFPDLTGTYKILGLIKKNKKLQILDSAPSSSRNKIMTRLK